ncbi:MAG: tetraacyldisaccharide 4'-kinase [Steroidobacterales bacterium]
MQAWLNRIWYSRPTAPWWLRPFAAVYGGISAARRFAYRIGWCRVARLSRPVVVVGNLTVGGTGKTPLVIWLAQQLAQRGFRPGIVTRGFGGSAQGARLAGPADDPAVVGDEALLMARRTGLPVAVGRDRPAAAQMLIDGGCDVIVSDDGLQHLALPRACEIIVIDAARGFGNGALLPAGPLRETPARLGHVDAIVTNGVGPYAGKGYPMQLRADHAIGLSGGVARPLAAFAGTTVHAVAGIGNPERFFSMLRSCGIAVTPHPMDDHAPIGSADISFGDDNAVLMTEKDAVKCAAPGLERHWAVPVDVVFADADAAALLQVVTRTIGGRQQRADEDSRG